MNQLPDCLQFKGYAEATELSCKAAGLHQPGELYLVDHLDTYRSRVLDGKLNTCELPFDARIDVAAAQEMIALGHFKKVILEFKNVGRCMDLIRSLARMIQPPEIVVSEYGRQISAYEWIARKQIAATNADPRKTLECAFEFDHKSHQLEYDRIALEYFPTVQAVLKLSDEQLLEHFQNWDYRRRQAEATRVLQTHILAAQKLIDAGQLEAAQTAILQGYKENSRIQKGQKEDIQTMAEEWDGFLERIKRWRGRPIIGLETKMKRLTDCLCGLRGFIVLAADTNLGKTMLATQMAVEALQLQPDLCCVMLSCEMEKDAIWSRIAAAAAGESWKSFVIDGTDDKAALATERTADIRQRFVLLETEQLEAGEQHILDAAKKLRDRTGCTRTMIIIDYVQVLPVPLEFAQAFRSDLDADRWRAEALRRIKQSLQTDDALIAISEVTKANRTGRLTTKDIMGSARLAYAPDTLLLWQYLSDEEKWQYIFAGSSGLGSRFPAKELTKDKEELQKHAADVNDLLHAINCQVGWLEIVKGRDGTRRESIPITAYYEHLTIEEGFFHGSNERQTEGQNTTTTERKAG